MKKPEVIHNPKMRFGKPIIAGTRITVEEVLGALAGGMLFEETEREYGLTRKQILSALKYALGFIQGEQVEHYDISSRREYTVFSK